MTRIVLASGSETRAGLLRAAGVDFGVDVPKIDEDAVRSAMIQDRAPARDIADALAELKAVRTASRHPDALVIGSDQVLDLDGSVLSKPSSTEAARDQLRRMRGRHHTLLSAAVVCEHGEPVWRHVGQARLHMRAASDAWLDAYVARNWPTIRHSVGCYRIEDEGVRLFDRIEGDHFTILGLPLVPLLSWLTLRGSLAG